MNARNPLRVALRMTGTAGRIATWLPLAAPAALFASCLSLAAPAALFAQQPVGADRARDARAVRAAAPPVIDGRLDEEVWSSAPIASGFMQFRPSPGGAASEATEVRVAYDSDALYIAARNRDIHPDSIVARLARRDQAVQSEWFTVLIDSWHDRRTALAFAVNPRGVQRDFTIIQDDREDESWDAVWEVATQIDAEGWTAEYRIPLSQLRFDGGAGTLSWGINFSRLIARRDELSYWSPVSPDVAGLVSQFGNLRGLREVPTPRGLELQPYYVTRVTRAPAEPGNPLYRATALVGTAGADFKLGIGSGLTVSGTINPDFGQVEADPSEVNLSANESRFGERRPFFVEGAEIFRLEDFPQVFYSRRIGAPPRGRVASGADFVDQPRQTTILGAAKLVGKTAGGWSIGVLDAVTSREEADWFDTTGTGQRGSTVVEPLTNFLIARVLRSFDRGASAVGAIATSVNRGSANGLTSPRVARAQVLGLDGRWRFARGNYELSGAALGSRLSGSAPAIAAIQRSAVHSFTRPDATHLTYDSTRTSLDGYLARAWLAKVGGGGWRWRLGGYVLSPGFDANELGFLQQSDRVRHWGDFSYRRYGPGLIFRRWVTQFGYASAWTMGGEREDLNAHFRAQGQLHDHASVQIFSTRWGRTLSTNALRGGPGLMEQGGGSVALEYESDARQRIRYAINTTWNYEDDTRGGGFELEPTISIRPSTAMDLSLASSFARDRSPAQYIGTHGTSAGAAYLVGYLHQTTAALTIRGDYTFSPKLSLQVYAQPFISAGRYASFGVVRNSRAADFAQRFRTLGDQELGEPDASGVRSVDLNADGAPEFRFAAPDFNVKHLNSNVVLRWEYRPGSTLFAVWGHGREHDEPDGRSRLGRDASRLFGSPATNVLMLKASYWLGL